MGKGTLTLGPYHCDRSLMMPVAVGGLLSVLVSFLDVKNGRLLIFAHYQCRLTPSMTMCAKHEVSFQNKQLIQSSNFILFAFTVILGKSHYVLFNLVSAMQPRMLVTFDTDLRPLPVSVRVGQVSYRKKQMSTVSLVLGMPDEVFLI